MNSFYPGVQFDQTKSSVNFTWSNTSNLNFVQTERDAPKPGKAGGADGNPYVNHSNKLPNGMRPVTGITVGSYELPSIKGTTFKILGGGKDMLSVILWCFLSLG